MTPITAKLILRDKVSNIQWIAIVFCIIGPSFMFYGLISTVKFTTGSNTDNIFGENRTLFNGSNFHTEASTQQKTSTIEDFVIGVGLGIATGVAGAFSTVLMKLLKDHLKSPLVLSFWYLVSSLLISGILMVILERDSLAIPSEKNGWLFLMVHTLSTVVSHTMHVTSMYFASAIVCNITFNLELPLSILCQYVIFEHLQPIDGSLYDIIGGIIITLGISLPSVYDFIQYIKERKLKGKESNQDQPPPITNTQF